MQNIENAIVLFQELCNSINDGEDDLEVLEKEEVLLSPGRSLEESKDSRHQMAAVRDQWQLLRSRALSLRGALSADVSHWNQYQTAAERLLPWLENVEQLISVYKGKSENLEEAKQHQQNLKV